MDEIIILGVVGSLRKNSYNRFALRAAQELVQEGVVLNLIDLHGIPVYDQDEEMAPPAAVVEFKRQVLAADAILFATPEYNYSVPGGLKNAIDWASRAQPGEAALACFDGKVAGLMAASPGALGGLRGLVTVRSILSNIRVMVLPEQVAVSKANEAFAADGSLKDDKQAAAVKAIGAKVVKVVSALKG